MRKNTAKKATEKGLDELRARLYELARLQGSLLHNVEVYGDWDVAEDCARGLVEGYGEVAGILARLAEREAA